ncbi:uncharacterized protein MELLADRAFT_90065 [Melampsora larici-populina 98AG31]|uniref:Uncharacterized protein n=1 Tax=Melampsora larici-populina (strain 98AG31 / pathotype 3-4-7) TaxID=747676 RepID=F4RVK7_MELLP|nr:uncharacterized protein MELLADRAFT_90065 [Melampsora larici-populina 98AG31]EGG03652.1 hypothetical protein MELLADRAFT_90065 [Melampsora larici-populina 98AG31]
MLEILLAKVLGLDYNTSSSQMTHYYSSTSAPNLQIIIIKQCSVHQKELTTNQYHVQDATTNSCWTTTFYYRKKLIFTHLLSEVTRNSSLLNYLNCEWDCEVLVHVNRCLKSWFTYGYISQTHNATMIGTPSNISCPGLGEMSPGSLSVVEGLNLYGELPPPESVALSQGNSGTKATEWASTHCSLRDDVRAKVTLGVSPPLVRQGEGLPYATGGVINKSLSNDLMTESNSNVSLSRNASNLRQQEFVAQSSSTLIPGPELSGNPHTYLEKGKWKADNKNPSVTPKAQICVNDITRNHANPFKKASAPKRKEDIIIKDGRTYRKDPKKDIKLTGKQLRERRQQKKTQKEISKKQQSTIDRHYECVTLKKGKNKHRYVQSDIGNIIRHADQDHNNLDSNAQKDNTSIAKANLAETIRIKKRNGEMLTRDELLGKLTSNRNNTVKTVQPAQSSTISRNHRKTVSKRKPPPFEVVTMDIDKENELGSQLDSTPMNIDPTEQNPVQPSYADI